MKQEYLRLLLSALCFIAGTVAPWCVTGCGVARAHAEGESAAGGGLKVISYQMNRMNGLPDNNIRCMAQDDDGYLWLGTLNGLYRFDGYVAQRYKRTSMGNRSLMRGNRISRLVRWNDGRLAVSFHRQGVVAIDTRSGMFEPLADSTVYVSRFGAGRKEVTDNRGNSITVVDGTENMVYRNARTGRVLTLRAIPAFLWSLSSDIKLNVVTDRRGLIWVSTAGGGITVYDGDGRMLRRITAGDGERLIPSDYITDMIEDRDGRILASEQWYGITILTVEERLADVVALGGEDDMPNAREVKVLTNMPDGRVVVANDMGRVCTLGSDGRLEPMEQLPADVEYLYVTADAEGTLLAGTRDNGLLIGGRAVTHMAGRPSIASNRVDRVLVDRRGRIWICNINGMVDMLELRGQEYTVRHFFTQLDGLEVRSMISAHDGRIWMGTNVGVVSFDPDSLISDVRAYTRYPLGGGNEEVRVTCLTEDSRRTVWAGTAGWGVFMRTAAGGGFKPFRKWSGMTRVVNAIVEDSGHNIWMAGDEGALCYSPDDGRTHRLYSEAAPLRNIFNSHCAAAFADGRVALGSLDGVLMTSAARLGRRAVEPRLRISEMSVNGEPVDFAGGLRLEHNRNSVVFCFSDLSFNADRSTYYSYRIDGLDMPWSEPSKAYFASFNALPPGDYTFRVRIVGGDDDTAEQTVAFTVLVPWWQTWWFRLLVAALLVAVAVRFWVNYCREQRLRQAVHDERLLTDYKVKFFTNISHEFRTPLTLIQGSMDKILSIGDMPELLRPSFYMMQRNVTRMRRLIDQFLEFRKMETGNMELRIEQLEMVSLLRDIFSSFRDISDRRRISYQFCTTDKQLVMFADRSYVDKIAYNLLSNAFKYTPVGGEITMSLTAGGGVLTVTVEDTGIGVSEEERGRLFTRYNKSTVESNSIGIGLNLAFELAHKHHGTLEYRPGGSGGSVFWFTLPLEKSVYSEGDFLQDSELRLQRERPGCQGMQEVRPMLARPMNDKTVLIVEDDNDILDFLQQEMSNYFHVEIASDGAEAIEVIEESMPDIMITDIRMPHMNGYELLRHIRKSSYRYLPVVMLTAVDTAEAELKSIEHGADVYLPKPFDMRILVAHCAALVQKFGGSAAGKATQALRPQDDPAVAPADGGSVGADAVQVTSTSEMSRQVITDERDRKFLERFDAYISGHIDDKGLNVDQLAEAMGYGRSKFYRKVTALLGCSPKEYIRKLRVERAAELLRSSDTITVSEVAYMTGFNTPQYFSTVFRAYYNMMPSEYQKGVCRDASQ